MTKYFCQNAIFNFQNTGSLAINVLQKLILQMKINLILSQFDSCHNQGCTLPKGKLLSSILSSLVSLPGASGFNGLPLPALKLYMFSIALFLVNKTEGFDGALAGRVKEDQRLFLCVCWTGCMKPIQRKFTEIRVFIHRLLFAIKTLRNF